MLESIPVSFQALLWPVLGAAVVGLLGRVLPDWMRRLLAVLAAGLSLLMLWSLRGMPVERVEVLWEPLGLFRASPTLVADELTLGSGILVCGLAVALLLGFRSREHRMAAWQAGILLSLAGALAVMMASNLLTLALGSALLDLALVGLALWAGSDPGTGREMSLALAVPGIASTLLLVANGLHLDVSAGHTSLLARELPATMVTFLGFAAVLRLAVFPLHPRGLKGTRSAASLLVPTAVGIYLLARVEALALGLWSSPWLLLLGLVALLAGGLLAWSGALTAGHQERSPGLIGFWTGLLVHQVGYALLYSTLLGRVAPWPLVSSPLALGALAILWHGAAEPGWEIPGGRLSELWHRLEPHRTELQQRALVRFPVLSRWPGRQALAWLVPLLPFTVLASLAGAPFTAGARVRWPVYAALLRRASGALLLILVADALLVAGLATAVRTGLVRTRGRRLSPAVLLAMAGLTFSLVVVALWPGSLGLTPARASDVSIWGLGLVFVLPWLLGLWSASLKARLQDLAPAVQSLVGLDWLYSAFGWVGQRVAGSFSWLGRVGEGSGWWGWALIVLALGAILLVSRS